MTAILLPVIVLGGLGIVFGGLLGVAAKAFRVERDERVEKIESLLPGANCGGCGYAGCSAMAKALAEGRSMPGACAVLKPDASNQIAELIGLVANVAKKRTAQVLCRGTCEHVAQKYQYDGIVDCIAAHRYGGGDKACQFGCSGYGTCASVCKFDAIHIVDGIAQIDPEKCVGCGTCVSVCPKGLIEVMDADKRTVVKCKSKEKGAALKDICKVGCIGCKICEKNCTTHAIRVKDNIATIQYSLCVNCGVCVEKCPKQVIEWYER
ncbi:MAG: RnfABCDGE type electron transport complex subunit B [Clostridia bacterium]|nr:RnfABCDGE type electron transport complex subunit B [Clostridia bacterium]